MSENPTVKCLVWDLDNTLWHGTLSEDEQVILTDEVRELIARSTRAASSSRSPARTTTTTPWQN